MSGSYRVEVQVNDGSPRTEWYGNGKAFKTQADAFAWVVGLWCHWTVCRAWRIVDAAGTELETGGDVER